MLHFTEARGGCLLEWCIAGIAEQAGHAQLAESDWTLLQSTCAANKVSTNGLSGQYTRPKLFAQLSWNPGFCYNGLLYYVRSAGEHYTTLPNVARPS